LMVKLHGYIDERLGDLRQQLGSASGTQRGIAYALEEVAEGLPEDSAAILRTNVESASQRAAQLEETIELYRKALKRSIPEGLEPRLVQRITPQNRRYDNMVEFFGARDYDVSVLDQEGEFELTKKLLRQAAGVPHASAFRQILRGISKGDYGVDVGYNYPKKSGEKNAKVSKPFLEALADVLEKTPAYQGNFVTVSRRELPPHEKLYDGYVTGLTKQNQDYTKKAIEGVGVKVVKKELREVVGAKSPKAFMNAIHKAKELGYINDTDYPPLQGRWKPKVTRKLLLGIAKVLAGK